MEKILLITGLFLLGLLSASRVFYWYFSPIDDLYSAYRNSIDINKKDIAPRLIKKRAICLLLMLAGFAGSSYFFFG